MTVCAKINKVHQDIKNVERKMNAAWDKLCDYCGIGEMDDGEKIYDSSLWENDATYQRLKKEYDYWGRRWSELSEQDDLGQMMLENGAY